MKDEMEEKILLYASDRFFKRDLKMTMESVAKELSISKKTLYKYFKNKDDLLNGVATMFKKDIADKFESTFKNEKDSFVAFCKVFAYLALKMGLNMDNYFIIDLQRVYPKLWKGFSDFRSDQINKYFPIIITSGIKNGYIRKDVNTQIAFMMFFVAVNNIVTPESLKDLSLSPKEAIKEILTIFIYGITTQQGKVKFNKHLKNIFEITNEK
jgi:AcrR family transcriptional regulator